MYHSAFIVRCFTGLLSTAVVTALTANIAHASCSAPDGQVYWTWPVDGESNANPAEGLSLMAFPGYQISPEDTEFGVFLNDAPVTLEPQGHIWGPIPLEPDTDYTLVVRFPRVAEYQSTFRTGAARALPTELPAPRIANVEAFPFFQPGSLDALSPECVDIFVSSDCYDTGPRDVLNVALVEDSARPWPDAALVFHTRDALEREPNTVREETWLPGSLCGPVNTHPPGYYDEQPCVEVRYRTPDGRYSEWSDPVCAEDWSGRPETGADAGLAADAGVVADDADGCSAAPRTPARSLPVLAALALSLLCNRRRGRRTR